MFNIIITKKQQTKLGEMVKKLFPEFEIDVCEKVTFDLFLHDIFIDCFYTDETGQRKHMCSTHWFEFCFTHLINRLQDKLSDNVVWRDKPAWVGNYGITYPGRWTLYSEFMTVYPKACWGGSSYPLNPIDFLYNEFKKIK